MGPSGLMRFWRCKVVQGLVEGVGSWEPGVGGGGGGGGVVGGSGGVA